MASEDYELYKVLQQERVQEGAARRATNKELFAAARQLAAQAGLTLVQVGALRSLERSISSTDFLTRSFWNSLTGKTQIFHLG